MKDGIGAVTTGKADIACGVAFTWGRSTQVSYSLPFGVGGTRLLTAKDAGVEVGSFDPEKDELRLKNGTTLSLRASTSKTLPVPGQGKPKPIAAKKPSQTRTVPVRAANGTIIRRAVTIPPRKPTGSSNAVVVPGRPVPPGSTRPSSAPGGRVRMVGQ